MVTETQKSSTRKKRKCEWSFGKTRCMKAQKPKKMGIRSVGLRRDISHELPEWLQEFSEFGRWKCSCRATEKPLAWISTRFQVISWTSNGSRAVAELGSGEHSADTHFPKDPNCDICSRTKVTRASCRWRTGVVVLGAENFGDLITSDHKVLSEGSESRNHHEYAVVVQDFSSQWLQSYPCKTLRRPRRTSWSSWSQRGNVKSFTLTFPWNLAKRHQHQTDLRRMLWLDSKELNLCCFLIRGHLMDQRSGEERSLDEFKSLRSTAGKNCFCFE